MSSNNAEFTHELFKRYSPKWTCKNLINITEDNQVLFTHTLSYYVIVMEHATFVSTKKLTLYQVNHLINTMEVPKRTRMSINIISTHKTEMILKEDVKDTQISSSLKVNQLNTPKKKKLKVSQKDNINHKKVNISPGMI